MYKSLWPSHTSLIMKTFLNCPFLKFENWIGNHCCRSDFNDFMLMSLSQQFYNLIGSLKDLYFRRSLNNTALLQCDTTGRRRDGGIAMTIFIVTAIATLYMPLVYFNCYLWGVTRTQWMRLSCTVKNGDGVPKPCVISTNIPHMILLSHRLSITYVDWDHFKYFVNVPALNKLNVHLDLIWTHLSWFIAHLFWMELKAFPKGSRNIIIYWVW